MLNLKNILKSILWFQKYISSKDLYIGRAMSTVC